MCGSDSHWEYCKWISPSGQVIKLSKQNLTIKIKGGGALLRLRETKFEVFVLVLKIGLGG